MGHSASAMSRSVTRARPLPGHTSHHAASSAARLKIVHSRNPVGTDRGVNGTTSHVLVDQYLAHVAQARRIRLELAADYLVMAAWLAYLKSRLLLPEPPAGEEPSGQEMADALQWQLRQPDVQGPETI